MAASVPFRGSFAWAWPRTKRLAESVWGAIVWLLTAAVAAVIAAFVVPQPTVTIAGQPLVAPDTAVATASRVIVGFVVGAAIALLGMFLLCLFRAPYQQRNELRRLFAESQRALAEADSERARRADPAFQRHLDDQHELARRAMQVLMPERFGQRSIGWGLISVYDEELIPLRGHFPEAAKGIEAWNAAYAAYVGAVTELTGTAQRMAADLNLEDRTDSGFAGLVQLEVKSLNASRVELSETPEGWVRASCGDGSVNSRQILDNEQRKDFLNAVRFALEEFRVSAVTVQWRERFDACAAIRTSAHNAQIQATQDHHATGTVCPRCPPPVVSKP